MDKIAEANFEIAANNVFSGEFVYVLYRAHKITMIEMSFTF